MNIGITYEYDDDLKKAMRLKEICDLLINGMEGRSESNSVQEHMENDWRYMPQIEGCLIEIQSLTEDLMRSNRLGHLTSAPMRYR